MKLINQSLKKYECEFDLAGTWVKAYIKNENKLYVFVLGQPDYKLMAIEKHKLVFKAIEGFKIEFIENESGSFNDIIVLQPNGTFKLTRKK